jgi:hypothetical protein
VHGRGAVRPRATSGGDDDLEPEIVGFGDQLVGRWCKSRPSLMPGGWLADLAADHDSILAAIEWIDVMRRSRWLRLFQWFGEGRER